MTKSRTRSVYHLLRDVTHSFALPQELRMIWKEMVRTGFHGSLLNVTNPCCDRAGAVMSKPACLS